MSQLSDNIMLLEQIVTADCPCGYIVGETETHYEYIQTKTPPAYADLADSIKTGYGMSIDGTLFLLRVIAKELVPRPKHQVGDRCKSGKTVYTYIDYGRWAKANVDAAVARCMASQKEPRQWNAKWNIKNKGRRIPTKHTLPANAIKFTGAYKHLPVDGVERLRPGYKSHDNFDLVAMDKECVFYAAKLLVNGRQVTVTPECARYVPRQSTFGKYRINMTKWCASSQFIIPAPVLKLPLPTALESLTHEFEGNTHKYQPGQQLVRNYDTMSLPGATLVTQTEDCIRIAVVTENGIGYIIDDRIYDLDWGLTARLEMPTTDVNLVYWASNEWMNADWKIARTDVLHTIGKGDKGWVYNNGSVTKQKRARTADNAEPPRKRRRINAAY